MRAWLDYLPAAVRFRLRSHLWYLRVQERQIVAELRAVREGKARCFELIAIARRP